MFFNFFEGRVFWLKYIFICLLVFNLIIWLKIGFDSLHKKSIKKFIEICHGLYFHGLPLNYCWASKFFFRISNYIGGGLCYESAALAMLATRDQKKTRFVIAELSNLVDEYRLTHAYVEIKLYGIWWVIDSSAPYGNISPKILHDLL